jgi:hypothetical protein
MTSFQKKMRPLSQMSRGQRMVMLALNKDMHTQNSSKPRRSLRASKNHVYQRELYPSRKRIQTRHCLAFQHSKAFHVSLLLENHQIQWRMVFVEARRGHNSLVYRTHFDGPDIPLNFLNVRATKSGIQKPACRMTLRGIPLDKKNDILTKLGPLMPENRKLFWQNIPVTDAADLMTDVSE